MASSRTRGSILFLVWLLALEGAVAFVPPRLIKVSSTSTRHLHTISVSPRACGRSFAVRGRSLRCSALEDVKIINNEFDDLLREKDLFKLLDVLRKHRSSIQLDWTKASTLLDLIEDSESFRKQVEDRMMESGEIMEDITKNMMNPASPVLPYQQYQMEQLEATSLVYDVLKEKQLLRGFSCLQDVKAYTEAFLPKPVTAADIEKRADLPMSALAPGKMQNYWLYGGALLCLIELFVCSYLGVDAGAVIPGTIFTFFLDRFFFGGRAFDQVARVLLPRYKERIIRHEAGHFLMAYLLGCPVQGCILRPVWNGAVFGEAGTVFLDKKLFDELDRNRISASSVDRYTTIVMSGIAAESLTFSNAEGGGSDEQSIILLLSLMNPPWQFERIESQARWGALRALLVLKEYREAYEALVEALTRGSSLGNCIKAIEDSLQKREVLVPPAAIVEPIRPPSQFEDLRQVLNDGAVKPTSSSSPLSRIDMSEEVKNAMEALRKVEEAEEIKPSFAGCDAIRLKEDQEQQEMAEQERALEARLRDLEGKLKRVNAKMGGHEGKDEEVVTEEQQAPSGKQVDTPVPSDSVLTEQLSAVDRRLKELKALLGEK